MQLFICRKRRRLILIVPSSSFPAESVGVSIDHHVNELISLAVVDRCLLHVISTSPYNADFDGDEMNLQYVL